MCARFFLQSVFGKRARISRRTNRSLQSRGHARIELLESRNLLTGLAWTSGAPVPVAEGGAMALQSIYGTLLVGGATNASGSATPTTARLYDSSVDTWTSLLAIDRGRSFGGIGETGSYGPVVTSGGETGAKYTSDIFLFGGTNANVASNTATSYSPTNAGENIAAPAMSTARFKLASATDPATGQIYAIGGLNASNQALTSVEVYDTPTDSWTTVAPLPRALYGASAASDGAGHILVFGGITSSGAISNAVYSYSIFDNAWSQVATMPTALSSTAAVYGAYGQIYVIGGKSASGAVADVNIFNPVTNTWDAETPLPTPEYAVGAVVDWNGNVDVMGGFNAAGNPVANVYVSAALPAPVGLPVAPAITYDSTWFLYDGTTHTVTPTAVTSDGYTPVAGTYTVTYNGSATPPVNAGTYDLAVTFTSADPNYLNTHATTQLYIAQATPKITVTGGGTITYDGNPHPISATEVGIDKATPVAGTITYTYNGLATAPVTKGTYTAVATFTSSDPNYTNTSATTTITIPDPTIPTGFTSIGTSITSVRLSWNPVAGAVSYVIYERHVTHSPKGSLSTITYPLVASGITGTSVDLTVTQVSNHTYYVASVSSSGAVSPKSAAVGAAPLSATSLYSFLWGGAVMSSAWVTAGQTLQVTLLGYGNLAPTYTLNTPIPHMTLDSVSGLVTYAPDVTDLGTHYVTFTATNSISSMSATFSFRVDPSTVTNVLDSGPGSLRQALLDAAATPGQAHIIPVNIPGSTSTITLLSPLPVLSDPVTLVVNGAQTVTIVAPVGGAGGPFSSLTKDGTGTLVLSGNGFLSANGTLNVVNGSLVLGSDLGGAATLNVSGATSSATFQSTQHLAALSLSSGAAASVVGSNQLLVTSALAVTTGAALDLGSNGLVVNASPGNEASALANVTTLLASGVAGGAWNGVGIRSSAAATDTSHLGALGVELNQGPAGAANMTTFQGEAVNSHSVLVKYTYLGDANLDGVVNGLDYAQADNGFNFGMAGWSHGDFNYDGQVSAIDYALLDNVFNFQSAPTAVGAVQPLATLQPLALQLPTSSVSDLALAAQAQSLALLQTQASALSALGEDAISAVAQRKRA